MTLRGSTWNRGRSAVSCALLAPLAMLGASHAQSTEVPATPQRAQVVIRHARVHACTPGHAPIVDGYVLFDGGRITAVGDRRVSR